MRWGQREAMPQRLEDLWQGKNCRFDPCQKEGLSIAKAGMERNGSSCLAIGF
jgi:hypothetical protein